MINATIYSVLFITQESLTFIVPVPYLYREPAEYGIPMPLSGSFVISRCTERLDDLMRGSESAIDDYAGSVNMRFGRAGFDIN